MARAQKRLGCYPHVLVEINDLPGLYLGKSVAWLDNAEPQPAVLKCTLDPALLDRILRREVHWNSAELACLIRFVRQPNVYDPDVHTLLCFLHE